MLAAKWQIAVAWKVSRVGLNGGLGLNPSSPSCAGSAENGRPHASRRNRTLGKNLQRKVRRNDENFTHADELRIHPD